MNILETGKVNNTSKTPERYFVKVERGGQVKKLEYMPRSYGFERYKGTPYLFPSEWKLVLAALNKYVRFNKTVNKVDPEAQANAIRAYRAGAIDYNPIK